MLCRVTSLEIPKKRVPLRAHPFNRMHFSRTKLKLVEAKAVGLKR